MIIQNLDCRDCASLSEYNETPGSVHIRDRNKSKILPLCKAHAQELLLLLMFALVPKSNLIQMLFASTEKPE